MMTLDMLAREIGCTLSDLDDLGILPKPAVSDHLISDRTGEELRDAWLAEQTRFAL